MTKLEKSRVLVRQSLICLGLSIAILFVAALIRHDFFLILGAVVSLISLGLCGYAVYLNPTRITRMYLGIIFAIFLAFVLID